MIQRKVAVIGLIVCFLYFASVAALIATGNQISIVFMETVTMLSGLYMVALFAALPHSNSGSAPYFRTMAVIFAVSGMVITNVVHFVYMTAISTLVGRGIVIPDYITLGVWPSVIMAADYLAWGLFIGLAFLMSSFAIRPETRLKLLLFINGCLCFAGFFGVVLINENLWYIAPVGYGIGTAVCCVRLLLTKRQSVMYSESINEKSL